MENEVQIENKPAICFLNIFTNHVKEKICTVSKVAVQMLFGTKKEEGFEKNDNPKNTCRQSIKKLSHAFCEIIQLNKTDPLMRNLFIIALVVSPVLLGPLTPLVALTGFALARLVANSEKINTFIEKNKPVLFVVVALSCYAFNAGVLPVAFAVGYLVNGILTKETSEIELFSPIKKNEDNNDLF